MKRIAFAVILAILPATLFFTKVASSQQPKASFTLTIAYQGGAAKSGQVRPLTVTEKNVSSHTIDISRNEDPSAWYRVEISGNGSPVPKTDEMLKREATQAAVAANFGPADPLFVTLKAGESAVFNFPISSLYDMTEPGVYQITLSRLSSSNTPVRSNTITVTVLPAG
jgi:hypothetical protein